MTFENKHHHVMRAKKNHKPQKLKEAGKKNLLKVLFPVMITTFMLVIVGLTGFFFFKIAQTTQTITSPVYVDEEDSFFSESETSTLSTLTQLAKTSDETLLQGYSDGRINILLLGVAGTFKPGSQLTDTIMLVSIDVISRSVSMLSIPRDFLVVTPSGNIQKINGIYADSLTKDYSGQKIEAAVEDITGQEAHYTIVMDFEGFTKVIDALGGINIDVPTAILDEQYPGPGYSYETFQISQGLQLLDGQTALKYARSRHTDPESDFGRAKRQQQVLRSARNKAFSLGTITNPFTLSELFGALTDLLSMNIAADEIRAFVALLQNVDTQNVTTVVYDAWKTDSLLKSVRIGGLSGLRPRTNNYKEMHLLASEIFLRDEIADRKESILGEESEIIVIDNFNNAATKRFITLLSERGFSDILTIKEPRGYDSPEQTMIIDETSSEKIFTLSEIFTMIDIESATDFPDDLEELLSSSDKQDLKSGDIIIILGDDIDEAYSYEEITEKDFLSSTEKTDE